MKRGIVWVMMALVLALVLGVGGCVPVGETDGTENTARDTDADATARVMRILLLGSDTAASLTDSMMLVTVESAQNRATVLQIPRDTYAEYTERDYKKLNGAVNAIGVDGLREFLEETLGVEIDCYVSLNPTALRELVDAIGGVDIDVPQDMTYSDPAQGLEIHLSAGPQRLSGAQAEQFVRYREGYVNADLGRLDAQKMFLRAFAKRCSELTFPETTRLVGAMLTTVQTDIPIGDAIRLAGVLRACDADTMQAETLAGMAARGESGAWYYVVNRKGAIDSINRCLCPETPVGESDFDRRCVFDREENDYFHAIYTAREEELPSLWEKYTKNEPNAERKH